MVRAEKINRKTYENSFGEMWYWGNRIAWIMMNGVRLLQIFVSLNIISRKYLINYVRVCMWSDKSENDIKG